MRIIEDRPVICLQNSSAYIRTSPKASKASEFSRTEHLSVGAIKVDVCYVKSRIRLLLHSLIFARS